MSAALAYPYRTIPDELCLLGQWERYDHHGSSEKIGDHIAGWDYDSKMDLGRSIELQSDAIIKMLGLEDSDAKLTVVITAETGPTSYRWIVSRVEVPLREKWQNNIRFEVSSTQLAQKLNLTTEVVLSKKVSSSAAFTANKLGSRLYRESQAIQLEGSLGRFPMEMIDFSNGLPFLQTPNALWYLDWDPSRPESQFLGTVLLYINSTHPEVSNLIQAAEPTILSILRCDVIRSMSQAMLQNEEFISNYAQYETDTVGGQVREWLQLAFGDEKPDLLKSKLDSSPGRFEARIQTAFS